MTCFMPDAFLDKRVFITGASRGIGRACALAFKDLGAKVYATCRDRTGLAYLGLPDDQVFSLDMRDLEAVEAFSRLNAVKLADILINNAGTYISREMIGHSLSDWRRVFAINLDSAMLLMQSAAMGMKERTFGRIINISSISGRQAEAFGGAYSASKFAMIGMTQALALETAQYGVTANCICPGWVETDLAVDQITDPEWCRLNQLPAEQSLDLIRFSIPQQKMVAPSEVAGLAVYLASEAARPITGQAINICGGLSIHELV